MASAPHLPSRSNDLLPMGKASTRFPKREGRGVQLIARCWRRGNSSPAVKGRRSPPTPWCGAWEGNQLSVLLEPSEQHRREGFGWRTVAAFLTVCGTLLGGGPRSERRCSGSSSSLRAVPPAAVRHRFGDLPALPSTGDLCRQTSDDVRAGEVTWHCISWT